MTAARLHDRMRVHRLAAITSGQSHDRPVEFVQALYRGDRYRFTTRN